MHRFALPLQNGFSSRKKLFENEEIGKKFGIFNIQQIRNSILSQWMWLFGRHWFVSRLLFLPFSSFDGYIQLFIAIQKRNSSQWWCPTTATALWYAHNTHFVFIHISCRLSPPFALHRVISFRTRYDERTVLLYTYLALTVSHERLISPNTVKRASPIARWRTKNQW